MAEDNMKNALNQILYKRMSQEYDSFIEKLKHCAPDEIIKASYEKVFKEDILLIVENGELMNSDIRALLREKYPLDGCYQKWLDEDISYMEELKMCVENHARDIDKHKKKEYER